MTAQGRLSGARAHRAAVPRRRVVMYVLQPGLLQAACSSRPPATTCSPTRSCSLLIGHFIIRRHREASRSEGAMAIMLVTLTSPSRRHRRSSLVRLLRGRPRSRRSTQRLRSSCPRRCAAAVGTATRARPGLLRPAASPRIGQYGLGGDTRPCASLSVAGYPRRRTPPPLPRRPHAAQRRPGAPHPASPRCQPASRSADALLIAGLLWVVGHVLANSWLKRRAPQPRAADHRGASRRLDLMVVCLEAGLGLNATIARVGEERSTIDDRSATSSPRWPRAAQRPAARGGPARRSASATASTI